MTTSGLFRNIKLQLCHTILPFFLPPFLPFSLSLFLLLCLALQALRALLCVPLCTHCCQNKVPNEAQLCCQTHKGEEEGLQAGIIGGYKSR